MKRAYLQGLNKVQVSPSTNVLRRSEELSETFKMLGNINRLRILVYLDGAERSVSEIEAALEIHQPTLSQQIGELRDAGLLIGRRAAKTVIYSVSEPRGRRALHTIYFAGGEITPHAGLTAVATPILQAAVFASVLTSRGVRDPDCKFGYKSPLQDE